VAKELRITPGDPDSVLEERSDIFRRCCGGHLMHVRYKAYVWESAETI